MPLRGKLKTGPRHNCINYTLHKKFMKETGIEISYTDFVNIIESSNKKIKQHILDNPEGFKLHLNLGFIFIKRYKNSLGTRKIDFAKSKKLGSIVYFTNFHSFGYDAKVTWFTAELARCKNINLYKFVPDKEFQKLKSDKLKEGKIYNEYEYSHYRNRKIRLNKLPNG